MTEVNFKNYAYSNYSQASSAVAFKGKPSAKDLKKAYKIVDELNRNAIYSQAVRGKSKFKLMEMFFSEKLQGILKILGRLK